MVEELNYGEAHWSTLTALLGVALIIVGAGITYAYRRILPYGRDPDSQPYNPPGPLIAIFMNFCRGAFGCFAAGIVLLVASHIYGPGLRLDPGPGMKSVPITLYYAAALGLLLLILTYNVLYHRVRASVEHFGEENPHAERIARVHANFTEYVPTGLGLLIVLEWSGAAAPIVHFAGSLFVAARYLHAYGYTKHELASFGRIVGIQSTLVALAFMSAALVYYAFAV